MTHTHFKCAGQKKQMNITEWEDSFNLCFELSLMLFKKFLDCYGIGTVFLSVIQYCYTLLVMYRCKNIENLKYSRISLMVEVEGRSQTPSHPRGKKIRATQPSSRNRNKSRGNNSNQNELIIGHIASKVTTT